MANLVHDLGLVADDQTINEEVSHTTVFTEMARQRINVAPGASAIDVTALFAQLGVAGKAKAIYILADIDGVVANLTTTAAQTAVVGCFPFFAMGLEDGITVTGDFALTVEMPTGDQTAHVDVIAVG